MSLVIRPLHKVGEYKGLDIILKSQEPTQNYEKFLALCEEFKKEIWERVNAKDH